MSKLLIDENPLVLLPSLAVKIGLNQAIVIQQIHYWLQASKTKINNKKWVYNTIDEWHEQFPFFSRSTLERTISSLIKDEFLIVEKLSNNKSDRTNYYTIDYFKLTESSRQNDVTITSNCCNHHVKLTQSTITSNCCNGYTENTETTTETTTDIKSAYALKITDWFDSFWQQYPNKVAKQAAQKAWAKLKLTEPLYQQIMIAVAKQKNWQSWQQGYIPHPSTWLNGKRWEDVEPVRVNGGGGDMAQYIREASERLRKQDECLNVFDKSFLLIGGDNE